MQNDSFADLNQKMVDFTAQAQSYLDNIGKETISKDKFVRLRDGLNEINNRIADLSEQMAGPAAKSGDLSLADLKHLKIEMMASYAQYSNIKGIIDAILTKAGGPQLIEAHQNADAIITNLRESEHKISALIQSKTMEQRSSPPRSLAGRISPERPRGREATGMHRRGSDSKVGALASKFAGIPIMKVGEGKMSFSGVKRSSSSSSSIIAAAVTSTSSSAGAVSLSKPAQAVNFLIDQLRNMGNEALHKEGIFRLSPSEAAFKKLKGSLDKSLEKTTTPSLPDSADPILTARLVKAYIKEMEWPEGFTNGIIAAGKDEGQLIAAFSELPDEQKSVLLNVFQFLHQVVQEKAANQMGVPNLATCIAPNVFDKMGEIDPVKAAMEGNKAFGNLLQAYIDHPEHFQ